MSLISSWRFFSTSMVLIFGVLLLRTPEVDAVVGYYLSAKEVNFVEGAVTSSQVLRPVAGAAIRFSFENPSAGNIAVYASFSSDTESGFGLKTGAWDIELYDNTHGRSVANSLDTLRHLSGLHDQGMVGLCHIFTDLKKGINYEVRLRHGTDAGKLRTKNVNMVLLPLFSSEGTLLKSVMVTSKKGTSTISRTYVDTNLKGEIFLSSEVTGAYILLTTSINSETSKGRGRSGMGTWRLQAGQGGTYKDYGVSIQRYLSGKNDVGSVVLHALAGPFDSADGQIAFKLQHKSSRASIRTYNGTLIAVALSNYDSKKGKQYDYTAGQKSIKSIVSSTGSSLTAVQDPKTGNGVGVSPNVRAKTRLFLGSSFSFSTPLPATVTFDIAEGDSPQVQAVERVTAANDLGAGCLFGLSKSLGAGTHVLDLRHATTSALKTRKANLVYVILGYE